MIKRVLITGANKGIGLATVRAVLAEAGTSVLLGARSQARGEAARASVIKGAPSLAERVQVLPIDVCSAESVGLAATQVSSDFGTSRPPLYGIINNAGMGIGTEPLADVLAVNTLGPKRVCDAFLPLLAADGRVVNVSSASGPNFVAACSPERQALLTSPEVTWADVEAVMAECLHIAASNGSFEDAGLGDGSAYGLSKALLNAYTIALARAFPSRTINACTPGFIETDLTRPFAEARGVTPQAMGMKSPDQGTRAALHLLLGTPGGSGWYFGSDAVRSPLDRYRSPGAPPYTP